MSKARPRGETTRGLKLVSVRTSRPPRFHAGFLLSLSPSRLPLPTLPPALHNFYPPAAYLVYPPRLFFFSTLAGMCAYVCMFVCICMCACMRMCARADAVLHLKHIGLYGNECLAMHRLLNIKKRRSSLTRSLFLFPSFSLPLPFFPSLFFLALAAGSRRLLCRDALQKTTRK